MRSGVLGLTLRRSAGLSTASIALALIAAQIAFRQHGWVNEWTWATYETGFLTILVAPVVAAAGAWEGHRQAHASTDLATYPRAWRATLAQWFGVVVWATVVFVIGVLVAWLMVVIAGTPGTPTVRDVVTVLPPLGFLAAAAAAGLALGRVLGTIVSIPVAAVLWFAATLYFYSVGPAEFVNVGGATGSLVALRPRLEVQLEQLAFFAALTMAFLAAAARRRETSVRWRFIAALPVVATLPLVIGAGALLRTKGRVLLEPTSDATHCVLTSPQICTAAGYQNGVRRAHDALAPYLLALRTAGIEAVPSRFDQTAAPGLVTVGPLAIAVLNGDRAEARHMILLAFTAEWCMDPSQPTSLTSWLSLDWYLRSSVDGSADDDPSLPHDLTHGTPDDQHKVVRDAAAYLIACSRNHVAR